MGEQSIIQTFQKIQFYEKLHKSTLYTFQKFLLNGDMENIFREVSDKSIIRGVIYIYVCQF